MAEHFAGYDHLTRGHQEVQQWLSLLAAGGRHRQEPLGEPTARFGVGAKAALAPQHRRSQRALGHID